MITNHEIRDADGCLKHNDIGGASIDILRKLNTKELNSIIVQIESWEDDPQVTERDCLLLQLLPLLKDLAAYVGPPRK